METCVGYCKDTNEVFIFDDETEEFKWRLGKPPKRGKVRMIIPSCVCEEEDEEGEG